MDDLRRKATAIGETASKHELKEAMVQYYENLNTLEKEFPIFSVENDMNVCFSWHDAFKGDRICTMHSMHLEKAAVLFNIASVYSQLAYEQQKDTEDGLKEAAMLFQQSSGVYSFLKKEVTARPLPQRETYDMCPLCLEFLEVIMIAQSQECVLEMVFMRGMADVTLARLAKALCNLFENALEKLSSKELQKYFDKSWSRLLLVKKLIYEGLASQHFAAHVRGIECMDIDERIRYEIGYLKHAKALISEATKRSDKTKSSSVVEFAKKRYDIIKKLLQEKMEENQRVYMQFKIPVCSDLEQIRAAAVVKPILPGFLPQPVAAPSSVTGTHSKHQEMEQIRAAAMVKSIISGFLPKPVAAPSPVTGPHSKHQAIAKELQRKETLGKDKGEYEEEEFIFVALRIHEGIEKMILLWHYLTSSSTWEEVRVFCEGYVKSLFPTSNVLNAFVLVILCSGLMRMWPKVLLHVLG